MIYAGIGSRQTPAEVLDLMRTIAYRLTFRDWTLRTGGADGADDAFLMGASISSHPAALRTELYLPWRGFNGHSSCKEGLLRPRPRAYALAAKHHPRWSAVKESARPLLARDVHQVLGKDCATPATAVICWTPDGATVETSIGTGGTGQAVRVAVAYGVPVWNLGRDDHIAIWRRWIADDRSPVPTMEAVP